MENPISAAWSQMRNYDALSAQELLKESVDLAKHIADRQRIANRSCVGHADDLEYALFQEELNGMVVAKLRAGRE